MIMRYSFLFVAASSALLAASPAQAQASSDGAVGLPARAVSYADLDLTRPAGIARLRHRIANAIDVVCGSFAGVALWQEPPIRQCRRAAFARAEVQIARVLDRSVEFAANAQSIRY
jgi:UrcA family protein